ncbi:zinc finger protein 862-like isoform X2 [Epinephelus fuscoguttatus]|uniref:zinc finger protein 862-like isoform X2 n=1 Tax=Epinephelus fuscoguttatus TaxID=293821 RepID=UPI0020D07EBA|nr:zinc finger protein 862-like isoform X2 [Epinephelus fuscoguttatus]
MFLLHNAGTDVSTKECEVVYVRLIEDGKPVNKLVGQQEVQHAHAKGILEATKAAFDELGADTNGWIEKLIGFGADGAALNMGHQRGAISLLKREIGDHVIPFHCMAHRLELVVLTLQKKEPMVAKVYELLHLVWKTYHYSPKSRRELQALGTELGVTFVTHRVCKEHAGFHIFSEPCMFCSNHPRQGLLLRTVASMQPHCNTWITLLPLLPLLMCKGGQEKSRARWSVHTFVHSAIFWLICSISYEDLAALLKKMT